MHPCTGCRAYSKPNRPIEGVVCPKIGRKITLEGCVEISTAHILRAERLIQLAIYRVRQNEQDKA